MRRSNRRAQTTLEFSVLLIIVIAALMSMANYIGRGMAGRWRDAVEGMGDQYDPRITNSRIIERLEANSIVTIYSVPNQNNGVWTMREDYTNSITSKTGFTNVGAGN